MLVTDKYVFFWKESFSQWYRSEFTDENGIIFVTCEQFMMYRKAILFDDHETANKILLTDIPKVQKELGRLVSNFNPIVWDEKKFEIVKSGNRFKFTQNEFLLNKLKLTKGKILVEASPYDRIWGIGFSEDDPNIKNEDRWGENLLGKAITEVRIELIGE
jgi:ribA/ribD-fused uncharacterized protein